jgi:hypothetical protein
MSDSRPEGSAIARLLAQYKQRLEGLPFRTLQQVYRREVIADIAETQFIDFASTPNAEDLIRTLVDLQACYLEGKTPLEIDDLLLDIE